VNRASFSSESFGPHLADQQKFSLWTAQLEALTCCVDITRSEGRPFSAFLEWADFSGVQISRFGGSIHRIRRSKSAISRGPDDDFCLLFHRGRGTFRVDQLGRETALHRTGAFLGTNGKPADMACDASFSCTTLTVSRDRLLPLVGEVDDLLVRPLDTRNPASALLQRYIEVAVDLPGEPLDPLLQNHISTTLLDLTALALGARGDAAQIASMRGLRASRTQEIIAEIDRSFANPGFSVEHVARRMGVSARYVQDLLQDTGQSFTERLLERRLQHAMRLLTSQQGDRMKVSDIALACGFNEVAYFNQRFRRRFGQTPTQSRR
jgi:AraC-like DNA-binding protein